MAKRRLGAMGVLPDEMVWEILTWLPTKSLMRFKAVSKLWLSTILDPNFARAYRAPFRGLLVMDPDPSCELGWSEPTRDFYLANLDYGSGGESNRRKKVNFSFQFSIPEDLRHFQATNLVHSIICFYDRNVAKLCNIATREIINLPESRCAYRYCTYHLGFDPTGGVYKLLKICPTYEREDEEYFISESPFLFMEGHFTLHSIECEILTLGVDSSWRSIHPPPNGIISQPLCVDGVLYWMTPVPGMALDGFALYSFNLAGEKFQSIYPPDDKMSFLLLQFGASPALADSLSYWPRVMITHFREDSWTEIITYTLDVSGPNSYDLRVGGLLPNGNLMLYDYEGVARGCSIYVFDEKSGYVQEFLTRFSASHLIKGGRLCWYEENIISLKLLTGF